jgi:hypothetical protein
VWQAGDDALLRRKGRLGQEHDRRGMKSLGVERCSAVLRGDWLVDRETLVGLCLHLRKVFERPFHGRCTEELYWGLAINLLQI